MDIATDMDALKTISNSISNLNILRKRSVESFLTSLLVRKARLIKLRDDQIKNLDKDIQDAQSIINGKCGF